MQSRFQRILAPCLGVFLVFGIVIGLFLVRRHEQYEDRQITESAADLDPIIDSLLAEKAQIEEDLSVLRQESNSGVGHSGLFNLLITQPADSYLTEIIPTIENAGFHGVISVAEDCFPGDEGCIDYESFYALMNSGWDLCMTVNTDTDIYALYNRILAYGFPAPTAAYFPHTDCTAEMRQLLAQLNIFAIIQYRSEIEETGLDRFGFILAHGAGEWLSGSEFSMKNALSSAMAVYIALGPREVRNQCDIAGLVTILELFSEYQSEGLGSIAGPAEAFNFLQENAEAYDLIQTNLSKKRAILEARRKSLDAQIKEAYRSAEQEN